MVNRRKRQGVKTMANKNLFGFFQDVRNETAKVTWPARREVMITTGMVFVMVVIASIFFVLADQIMRTVVGFILGVGH